MDKQTTIKNNRSIPYNTLRLLYAHSGNCCAFEGCHSPIFEDDGTLTGECCHIESYSPNGPRYNKQQTETERNGYDNLILMCARHHKIIDSHPEQYTVEKLKSFKKNHESIYKEQQLNATDVMIKQLLLDSEKYWSSLKRIEETDETGFKLELGKNDIYSLMKEVNETYEWLQELVVYVSKSSLSLQDDLKSECKKCGINYNLFDKIPYHENRLINRDLETINLAFPNCLTKLKIRYFQLCVNLLEKLVIYDPKYSNLLNKSRRILTLLHKSAYYIN